METATPTPAQRRRGRPQRLPFEPAPTAHAPFDVDCRLAWLLATSRLLTPATAELPREAFLERIRAQGVSIDASRISRWESGQLPATHKLVAAYESVIGLPDGALWATSRLLHRSAGADARSAAVRPVEARTSEELDDLFDRIESRTATGGHWLRMTSDLAHFERVYLHRTTWTTLCTQLVAELTRSSGIAFFRRYEAACALLAHPQGGRHLSRSLGRFVLHPDVQNVAPAITLLREVSDQAAGGLVLRLMSDQNKMLRRGARGVAAAMVARDRFPVGSVETLEHHTGAALRKRGAIARNTDAIDLATQLPDDSYDRVLAAIPEPRVRRRVEHARETMELVPRDLARAISEAVATYAEAATRRAAYDPDQMLRRLVRESLFHVQRERRHLASVLVAVSPYGEHVARAVLDLASDGDDLVANMSWSVLRRMGHVLEGRRVVDALADELRDGVRARGLVTLGLTTGPLSEDAAEMMVATAKEGSSDALRHAAVFALGMTDHERLRVLATEEPDLARSVGWWRSLGLAIHDADVAVPA